MILSSVLSLFSLSRGFLKKGNPLYYIIVQSVHFYCAPSLKFWFDFSGLLLYNSKCKEVKDRPKNQEDNQMNAYFTAIVSLLNALADQGFPSQLQPCLDGWKLVFPWFEDADIACNSGTGGWLESYGFPWDEGDTTKGSEKFFCHKIPSAWALATY